MDKKRTREKEEREGGSIEETKYIPESKLCESVNTVVPPSMRYELRKALETVDRRVNGVDAYVAMKLGYTGAWCTADERIQGFRCLCEAYGAEQVNVNSPKVISPPLENKALKVTEPFSSRIVENWEQLFERVIQHF